MNNLYVCRIETRKHIREERFLKTVMIAVAGYAVGKLSEISVKLIQDKRKQLKQNRRSSKVFKVNGIYSSEDGFELTFGDTFKVLEQNDKYALVRKEGKFNEAHRIPVEVLNSLIENQSMMHIEIDILFIEKEGLMSEIICANVPIEEGEQEKEVLVMLEEKEYEGTARK